CGWRCCPGRTAPSPGSWWMGRPTPPSGGRAPRWSWTNRPSTRWRWGATAVHSTTRRCTGCCWPSARCRSGPEAMDGLLSDEVETARDRGSPVVLLESSVLAQGLPFPSSLEAARAMEEAVRRAGAVPAVVAVVRGRVRCGLSTEEVRALATGPDPRWKVASRDLAPALLHRG